VCGTCRFAKPVVKDLAALVLGLGLGLGLG
jgi:hypothetical protein